MPSLKYLLPTVCGTPQVVYENDTTTGSLLQQINEAADPRIWIRRQDINSI